MKGKNIIWLFVAGILSGLLVTFAKNYTSDNPRIPTEGYRVYLEGKSIGLIKSKDELNGYINVQQEKIKDKYHVDNVYIPNILTLLKK